MFGINLKHSLATVAVAVAVVAAAGSASAGTHHSGVLYNGHAGLGASVYQHNQTDLEFLAHERCDNRGRPAEFSNRLALNDQSPQLELIQPLTGTSTHPDWLQEHGEGPLMSASSSTRSRTPSRRPSSPASRSCRAARASAPTATAPGPISTPATLSASWSRRSS
jgi:hypothetical protein